jgi:hypothetical protein
MVGDYGKLRRQEKMISGASEFLETFGKRIKGTPDPRSHN